MKPAKAAMVHDSPIPIMGAFLLHLLLSASYTFAFQLIAFDGKPVRWKNNSIRYAVDQRGSDDFSTGCDSDGACQSERSAIASAFRAWAALPNVNLQFIEDQPGLFNNNGNDGRNTIVWIEKGWTAQSYSPPAGALAVTISTYTTKDKHIIDSDIFFNGENFTWGAINTTQERNSAHVVDIQNIATHEIGHFIGLDHSSEDLFEPLTDLYMATMYYASGPGETFRRELKADDIAAAQHLYGSSGFSVPQVSSFEPDSFEVHSSAQVTLKLQGDHFGPTTSVRLIRGKGHEDVSAKVISLSSDSMELSFDFYGLPSGSYPVVVANSYSHVELIEDAIRIESPYSAADVNDTDSFSRASSAGCRSTTSAQALWPLLLIFVALLPPRRLSLSEKRISSPQ